MASLLSSPALLRKGPWKDLNSENYPHDSAREPLAASSGRVPGDHAVSEVQGSAVLGWFRGSGLWGFGLVSELQGSGVLGLGPL